MKNLLNNFRSKALLTMCFTLMATFVFAQANVEVNGQDVGSWLSRHWLWVAGGVILLIILIGAFSSSRTRTTVTRTDGPGYTRTTTTETVD
jgi:hypothetical protein